MRSVRKFAVVAVLLFGVAGLSFAPAQDKKKDDKKDDKATVTAIVFEVYKDKGGEFRFRLKEGEHSLAISGHGYKTVADVEKVIDQIKKDVPKAKIVDDTNEKKAK